MSEKHFPEKFSIMPRIWYMAVANFDLNYRNEWHNSHYNDLIYIISGNMTVILPGISDLEYPVNAGEVLLMKKDIRHKDIFKLSKGLKALVISYIWDGDDDFLPPATPVHKLQLNKLPEIQGILENIRKNCHAYNSKDKDYLMIQQCRLHSALLLLYNFMNNNYTEPSTELLIYKPEKLLKAAEYYISCNYASVNLNKREVANALSVSTSTLTRAFERCSGYSFITYLTSVRLEKAQQLLSSGKYRISEIAQLCGFADAGYFSRVFKKVFGYAPAKYR